MTPEKENECLRDYIRELEFKLAKSALAEGYVSVHKGYIHELEILANHTHKLALNLECMVLNPDSFYDESCNSLDAYRTDLEKLHPNPPTFMGEPI